MAYKHHSKATKTGALEDFRRGELSKNAICRKWEVHGTTLNRWIAEAQSQGFLPDSKVEIPVGPVPLSSLGPEARRALDDFPFFFERYIAPTIPDWLGFANFQREVVDLAESSEHRYLLVTLPPGFGKTILLLGWVVWRIVRDRNVKGLFITKSERLARWRLHWVKGHLERNERLLEDFGSFTSAGSDETWTQREIQVLGASLAKDATFAVYGAGQQILGTRVDFIVADDVVDTKNSGTPEMRQTLENWWQSEVQTRLEPTGAVVVLGSRLGPFDLYGFIGRLASEEDAAPLYTWVRLKAHDLSRCGGAEHHEYPEGCLLFPGRWSYKKLMEAKVAAGKTWGPVWQQEDVAAGDVLVHRAWIFGGSDHDGFEAEGCLDHVRGIADAPRIDALSSVVTIDPSPSRYWAVEHWLVEKGNPPTWHLFDIERTKMGAAELLDFSEGGKPLGLLADWVERAQACGHPIKWIIVEHNAAQRWLLQMQMAKDWARRQNIEIIPHMTTSNKADPKLGVWSMGLRFREGRVRIPYRGALTKARVTPFIEELTTYPHAQTDDTVLASWFLMYNEDKLREHVRYEFQSPPSLAQMQSRRRVL